MSQLTPLSEWLARPDLSLATMANSVPHVGAWGVGVQLALAWVDSLATWLEVGGRDEGEREVVLGCPFLTTLTHVGDTRMMMPR